MSQKNMYIAVVVGIVVVAIFIGIGAFGVKGFGQAQPATPATNPAQDLLTEISKTGTVADLRIVDTVVGTGAEAKAGDIVTVNYTGVLPDGTVFDASANHGQPFTFNLGAGQVIKGWDQGVAGMKVGGQRLLAIPPAMAYGDRAMGKIPANATLIFQVELVSVGGAK